MCPGSDAPASFMMEAGGTLAKYHPLRAVLALRVPHIAEYHKFVYPVVFPGCWLRNTLNRTLFTENA